MTGWEHLHEWALIQAGRTVEEVLAMTPPTPPEPAPVDVEETMEDYVDRLEAERVQTRDELTRLQARVAELEKSLERAKGDDRPDEDY